MNWEWTKSTWDLNVEAAPSLFPTWGNAYELALECQKAGMAGFALKSHHGSSVEIAEVLNHQFSQFKVYGGLSLNHFVGGINMYAVEAAVQLGAKFIWLPSIHAKQHYEVYRCFGSFDIKIPSQVRVPKQGLSVLQEKSKELNPEIKELLHYLDGKGVIVGTAHLSPAEIFAIQKYQHSEKIRLNLLINHVLFPVPGATLRQLKELQSPSTWFEFAYLSVSPLVRARTTVEVAQVLKDFSEERSILVSATGQKENLKSPDALEQFAYELAEKGVKKERLKRMLKDSPKELLEAD